MTIRRLALFAALPLLAVAALLAVVAQGTGAQAEPVDLSGEWELTVRGLASFDELPCGGTISQQETSVSLNLHCQFVEKLALAGTVDQESGNFSLTGEIYGIDVVFFGEASGDRMHGSISHRDSWGSFDGTRDVPLVTSTPTPIGPFDLSGDWLLTLGGRNFPRIAGEGAVTCIVYLGMEAPSITGGSSCDSFGTSNVAGSVDLDTETFSLDLTNTLGTFALSGRRDERGVPSGSYTLSIFPGVTNEFSMSRLRANYWGNKVCRYTLHQVTQPQPPPVFGESAAAIDALRLAAGLGQAWPGPAYACNVILDVNLDGVADGRDTALILQHVAGLIPRLPVL